LRPKRGGDITLVVSYAKCIQGLKGCTKGREKKKGNLPIGNLWWTTRSARGVCVNWVRIKFRSRKKSADNRRTFGVQKEYWLRGRRPGGGVKGKD